MKKLLVLCPYPEKQAPSQRLKFEQYYPHFRENGYEITIKPFMSQGFWNIAYKPGKLISKAGFVLQSYWRRIKTLFVIHKYDVVYIHLWVTPFGPPFFEWMVMKLARKVVYDIDDLVYMKNKKADKWYTYFLKGRGKPVYLIKKADHVITCTPYLDEFARKLNPHTTDISSTINTGTYLPVNKYANQGELTLGWSGSHSTIRYLQLLQPVLKKLSEQVKFNLLVMGEASFSMEGVKTESHAWSEEKEISTLQQIDIGLYPLPLDEEWVFGKSGLKALQYMALGIPTIATAIGANYRVIENGEDGFLVTTNEEWIAALHQLLKDPVLRKRMGEKARQKVQKYYSIKANEPVYLDILNKVSAKK